MGQHLLHCLEALPHRQPPYRVTREIHPDELGGALLAQRRVRSPLHDAEERLVVGPLVGPQAFRGPPQRPFDRRPVVLGRRIGRRALVECHDDVGPQRVLHLDAPGRRQLDHRAIHVTLEDDLFVRDAVNVRQGKDLEPPAVGKDRPRPGHEAVQIAEVRDHPLAGAEHQVIGVRQDDLCAGRGDVVGEDSFDRPLRADGHERRGVERPVARGDSPEARVGRRVGADDVIAEGRLAASVIQTFIGLFRDQRKAGTTRLACPTLTGAATVREWFALGKPHSLTLAAPSNGPPSWRRACLPRGSSRIVSARSSRQ